MVQRPSWIQELPSVSNVGIVGFDAAGTVRTFSRNAETMFGYSAEEVIGHDVSLLLPTSDRTVLESYLHVRDRANEAPATNNSWNVQAQRADGSLLWVRLTLDESLIEGQTLHVGMVVDDLDHQEARYWLDEFFELTSELISVTTFDGQFVHLNPAWQSILGYDVSELLTRSLLSLVYPEDEEATATAIADLIRGEQVGRFENRLCKADGSYRWFEWSAKPMHEHGLIMATAHDVSRRHRTEAQLRAARDEATKASQSKSEFLSRMSHELRTPLNSVIGFSQLLAMDDLSNEQRASVSAIQNSGRHLLDLINEVLDIVQIEAGELRLSLEPVELAEELHLALDLIALQAKDREIALPSVVDSQGICVLADRQRLLQILLNLLSNAVKYNKRGGLISIEIDASGDTVSIAITDTGIGIEHTKLDASFMPFERLGAETTSIEGTGIGLALSRTLSQQMGGALTASSTFGVGSTFCLELPQADPPDRVSDVAMAAEGDETTDSVGDRSLKVLYIEDNIANSQLMERALRTQGNIELVISVQGRLGYDLANQIEPDLILLDLHLPDLSGEEVLQRVRATPAIADTTVVVCSADASPGLSRRLLDSGADAYLTKPIDLTDLFDVVRRVRAREPLDDPRSDRN